MDFDALKDLQPADYQSSSSDDSSDEELQKKNDGSSSSSSDDGIMDADDELRMKLQQETGFGGENMKFVDMTKSKKKKNKGKNIEQQLPLDFSPEIKAIFERGFKCESIHKNENSEISDFSKIFCFPCYYGVKTRNNSEAHRRVFKMQVRGDKLAVFGIEYFHSDTTKPNEHQLYRLDGNLTNQPPVCRYDELGEAKIVENQTNCWLETEEKTKGIRLFTKCTVTDEISSQVRIYTEGTGEDLRVIIENNRTPRLDSKISIFGRYKETDEKPLGEEQ